MNKCAARQAAPQGPSVKLVGASFKPVVGSAVSAVVFSPATGAITPLKALTTRLVETYHTVNPSRQEQQVLRRVLTQPSKPAANGGFDNELGDLIVAAGDQVVSPTGRSFEVLKHLGRGTFGQVLKVQSIGNRVYAVKVIRNRPAFLKQAEIEVELLQRLRIPRTAKGDHSDAAKDPRALVVQMYDHFVYKNHLCLVFEELGVNLLQLLQQNHCRGLSISLIRYFTKQLLKALQLLRDMHIVHCDIKPENVLLQNLHSPAIKLIDFGSACATAHPSQTYIQSRFYRSPEVLLGCSYGGAIDMWSLGAIVGELFLGLPLFPGESEYNQLFRIVQMRGPVPDGMISAGSLAHKFFAPLGSGSCNSKTTQPDVEAHSPLPAVTPSSHFRFKTEAEYCRELSCPPCRNKQYFKHTELPDLIAHHPRLKPLESEAEKAEDRERRCSMLHCLQGLLLIDPSQRWTPRQALRHPFVTGEPFQTELSLPFNAEPTAKPTGSTPSTGSSESDGFASSAPHAGATPPMSAAAAAGDSATVGNSAPAARPAQPSPAAVQGREAPTQVPSAAAPAEAQPPVHSQPQPVHGLRNGGAPHMIPIAPPMCYSPGMAYSRSPPAYYGSPLCALSPPSMQTLAIAMTNSPSQSFSPACMYESSSPPVRPDGHVNMSALMRPGAGFQGSSLPLCAPCCGGACCGAQAHTTPQIMGEWGGEGCECSGEQSGGSLLPHRAPMSCEGHHFMVATEAHNALQYAPRHVDVPSFFGHPSCEQGEYAQQQYIMPGPPAALPMRLAVNTESENVKGQLHYRGERKRNGSQREQQPRSPPSETGPGANEQTELLPLASKDSETGLLLNGENKVNELVHLSFNEVFDG